VSVSKKYDKAKKGTNSARKIYNKSEPCKGKDKTENKVKYVVKIAGKREKENISPKVVEVMEKLSPLREPTPFDLEFEDMLSSQMQMITIEEGELFEKNRKVVEK